MIENNICHGYYALLFFLLLEVTFQTAVSIIMADDVEIVGKRVFIRVEVIPCISRYISYCCSKSTRAIIFCKRYRTKVATTVCSLRNYCIAILKP